MADTVAGRRITSNSRGPGQDTVVYAHAGGLVLCPKCGTRWMGGAWHAPHFSRQGVLVDCIGDEVQR